MQYVGQIHNVYFDFKNCILVQNSSKCFEDLMQYTG